MRLIGKLITAGVSAVALMQLIRPGIPSGPTPAEIQAPPQVLQILRKDCYSCHSNERRLAWFDEIVPGYWLVRHDVLKARERLNFSTIGSKPSAAQRATLYEAVNMIQLGAMPLHQFTDLHPDARVTSEELVALKTYLAPWSMSAVPLQPPAGAPFQANLYGIPSEFNGEAFQPDFENWKPISFTDRGDNNSVRIILGNEIAVKAAQSGEVSPWPDGTRFAKIAWQKAADHNGLIHPGNFIQVEFMMKSAKLYNRSQGWGWGRWRGAELKPYGTNARFVSECTGCHQPMRKDDFVYTLPISRAKATREEVLNSKAALPQNLPYQPLDWGAITMYIDPGSHTMATLYGNSPAIKAVRGGNGGPIASMAYPPGTVIALVTWTQRDDPHWFGGRIPDKPMSVEFVRADDSGRLTVYRCYDGPALREHDLSSEVATKQVKFIGTLTPAWLP